MVRPIELIALASGSSFGTRVTSTASATAMMLATITATPTRRAWPQASANTCAERSTRKSHTGLTPKKVGRGNLAAVSQS